MNKYFKQIILLIGFLIAGNAFCLSQDTLNNDSATLTKKILWIGKYPQYKNDADIKISKKIINFITGKKTIVLKKPISVVVDNSDIMWITDQGMQRIIKVKNNFGEVLKVFKKDTNNFSSLVGLCLSFDNNILFTDSYLNSVFLFNENKNQIIKFNKNSELIQPTGIAYSNITKEIWVVETAAHRISVFNKQGKLIKRIGKRGKNPGEFNFPTFIWIDKLGTIYVVDSLNFRIQIFDKTGKLISVFGKLGDGTGDFARPKGIAVDSYGNIYVADALFNAVQIFDKSGNFLYSFGSQGRENGKFWMPTGIFIDKKDYIYVADSYNSRIQIFKLSK
ncbi:MAG: 6-bladed beta-propeller [Chlorobi bacterium]|nr:6-bladed beta-propeller [Chlorobiota bacterium]